MTGARLRECLRTLRWTPADLADSVGCDAGDVATWLDGRAVAPLGVLAWLEALVRVHQALPPPKLGAAAAPRSRRHTPPSSSHIAEPAAVALSR